MPAKSKVTSITLGRVKQSVKRPVTTQIIICDRCYFSIEVEKTIQCGECERVVCQNCSTAAGDFCADHSYCSDSVFA